MWNEPDLRAFLSSITFVPKELNDDRNWVELAVRLCLAIGTGDFAQATRISKENSTEYGDMSPPFVSRFKQSSLWFGAERDLRIIRYFVEVEDIPKDRILSPLKGIHPSFASSLRENPLLIAMQSGNEEVVEYLLQDWYQLPMQGVTAHHPDLDFNSKSYFDEIFRSAPHHFASMSYEDQSVWFFCKRYLNDELPEENWIESAMKRLEGDEDILMNIARLQEDGVAFKPLWELYGHSRVLFLATMSDAEAIQFHYFLPLFHALHNNILKREQFLQSWSKSRNLKRRATAVNIALMLDDWDNVKASWIAAGGKNWTQVVEVFATHDYPFLHGLQILAQELPNRVLQRESEQAIKFMSQLIVPNLPPPFPSDQTDHSQHEFRYLFASAGSGKTYRMFNMLQRKFGFYLVSGGVTHENLPNPSESGEQLYHPRANTASGDSELLFRIIRQRWQKPTLGKSIEISTANILEGRCEFLCIGRLALFCEVFKRSKDHSQSWLQPWHWFQYQMSCNQASDPFRTLFHCLILVGNMYSLRTWLSSHVMEEQKYNLLWCFDEVQCDTIMVAPPPLRATILSTLVSSLFNLRGEHKAVLTGTSMNFDQVKKEVEIGAEMGILFSLESYFDGDLPNLRPRPLDRCELVNDDRKFIDLVEPTIRAVIEVIWDATLPQLEQCDVGSIHNKLGPSLVGNETIFEDSVFIVTLHYHRRHHGLLANLDKDQAAKELSNRLHSNPGIWDLILQGSIPLRGRYRWSVCYIEELFKSYIENIMIYTFSADLTKTAIFNISKAIQLRAKEPLKQRIHDLVTSKDTKRQILANDVFHLATQAELFGRSRILNTAEAAILIEQSIAYVLDVDNKEAKVCIAEGLVIDAAMEYLRARRPPGSRTDEHLGNWQYLPSAFGFKAEDRLAEAIYEYTHWDKDVTERQDFLLNFDGSFEISPTSGVGQSSPSFSGCFLEQNPGPVSLALGGDGDVGIWLFQVIRGAKRPTFLLPSNSAGPDLMFVLRNRSGDRFVCAVQSKIVVDLSVNDSVQNTLDPDQWYQKATKLGKREQFLLQLDSWKKEVVKEGIPIRFLSVLVDACHEEKNIKFSTIVDNLRRKKKDLNFAIDIVSKAKNRKDVAEEKLRENKEKEKEMRLKANVEKAQKDIQMAIKIQRQVTRTNYFFKIWSDEYAKRIFGQTFYRFLRGIKGKSV